MFLRGTLLGILLFNIFWTETALAGSSFLSPAYRNIQQQKNPRTPTTRLQRRGTEGFWNTDEAEDDNSNIELKFIVPFEIGVKMTEREYQEYGQALEKMLQDVLQENAKGT
ncbi:GHRL protein, partial [Alectura lathami]|nr:GHRL protein [Alectura lathami]